MILETEVISYDIPLLLSKDTMKTANTVIGFKDDSVTMFGNKAKIYYTETGHYCVNIKHQNKLTENIALYSREIDQASETEKKKIALKLHRQFGHAYSNQVVDI